MTVPVERIAELEWANYAATQAIARVTPGLDLAMEEDAIITSSPAFPMPDANHACLLRATPQTVDPLIDRIVNHFQSQDLPVTVYTSEACTPADIQKRLRKRGFSRQRGQEAWIVYDDVGSIDIPPLPRGVDVRQIGKDRALTMAEVFMESFGMPAELAPLMVQLLEPSIDLPEVHQYMAFIDERPAGVCSLIRYQQYAVLGSAGVLPAYRGSRAATALTVKAMGDAQRHAVETVMLQTIANAPLERLLRISGFKRAFTRMCYTLP
jgi:ribosomal protein S18 acetylase RimI-like enzyme